MDELEWQRIDRAITDEERDQGVSDLIDLVAAIDGMLQAQSAADAEYFLGNAEESYSSDDATKIGETVLRAYRWQYIVSGVQHPRFSKLLSAKITPAHGEHLNATLARIM